MDVTYFLQRTRGLYFNGEHLCAVKIKSQTTLVTRTIRPDQPCVMANQQYLKMKRWRNLSAPFDEINSDATPTAPLVQSCGSLISVFRFLLSLFPLIRKVGYVGSFVRHKFWKLRYMQLSVTYILIQSTMWNVNLHQRFIQRVYIITSYFHFKLYKNGYIANFVYYGKNSIETWFVSHSKQLITRSVQCSNFYSNNLYRPQRSCEGYVFTPVCHSVHRGVGLPQCILGYQPPGADTPPGTRHPLEQTPPEQGIPQSRHPPEQTPPGTRHPPGPGTPRDQTPPSRRLLLRTVRILLECILVDHSQFCSSHKIFEIW